MSNFLQVEPVLPSKNIARDVQWHAAQTGFELLSGDNRYAVLKREHLYIHLQWHADTKDDPLLGGSVIPIFKEFMGRGTVTKQQLRSNTPWGTHEFGFFDLNQNAIFIVQDVG